MSDPKSAGDVLSKADDFIRRRRAQLGGAALEPTPRPAPAEDDIPLLTEIVADAPHASKDGELGVLLARQLETWLDENLPQVVMHVLDGVTDKLIQQVHESAHADLLPRLQQALRPEGRSQNEGEAPPV